MAKDKDLDDLEDELRRLEEELAEVQGGEGADAGATTRPKKSILDRFKTKADTKKADPQEEPGDEPSAEADGTADADAEAPEPKAGVFDRLKEKMADVRKPGAADEADAPEGVVEGEADAEESRLRGLLARARERRRSKAPEEEPDPAVAEEAIPDAAEEPSLDEGPLAALGRFSLRRSPEEPAAEPAPDAEVEPEEPETEFEAVSDPPEPEPAPVAAPEPEPVAAREPHPQPLPMEEPAAARAPGRWVRGDDGWRFIPDGSPAPPPGLDVNGDAQHEDDGTITAPPPSDEPPAGATPTPPDDRPPKRRRLVAANLVPLAVILFSLLLVSFLFLGALPTMDDAGAGTNTGGGDPTNTTGAINTPGGLLKAVLDVAPGPGGSPTYVVNKAVRFDASNSLVPASGNAAYTWNFGDGTQATGVSVTHAYSSAGDHDVTLTVTLGDASSTASTTVTVVNPPTASLSASPSGAVLTGEEITLDAGGSAGEGDLTYAWDLGDGNATTGATATHAYARGGMYTITLTVTDALGGTATDTTMVHVGILEAINGTLPVTTQAAASESFAVDATPGALMPATFNVTITYPVPASTGLGTGSLDELVLRVYDANDELVESVTGVEGEATIEITSFDAFAMGTWTVEVERPQGATTSSKDFAGTITVAVPAP